LQTKSRVADESYKTFMPDKFKRQKKVKFYTFIVTKQSTESNIKQQGHNRFLAFWRRSMCDAVNTLQQ